MIRIVLGTRPESLKVLPIIRELQRRKMAFQVIHTGQHQELLAGTGIQPDVFLHVPSQNDPLAYVGAAQQALEKCFTASKPDDWVVVQGDTASALAGARAAVQQGVRVAHVEAGLRSGDLNDPWPEEGFRIEIDRLATLHCCPTEGDMDHLLHEPNAELHAGRRWAVHVTGNTIVDQLRHMGVTRELGNHVLVTLHRREAFGEPLRQIVQGLSDVADQYPDTPFLWPMHPNPKIQQSLEGMTLPVNVLTRNPLPYHGFIQLLASAKAVLTDSGGVVEEACTLGVPTVIARDHTERPEALGTTAWLAGKTREGVGEGLRKAFLDGWDVSPQRLFGDGHAAERIVDCLT